MTFLSSGVIIFPYPLRGIHSKEQVEVFKPQPLRECGMKKVLGFLLMGVFICFGEGPPKGMAAVTEEAAKVLQGFGCTCEIWEGVYFCKGKPEPPFRHGWQVTDRYIRFYCSEKRVRVPYSNVIAY